MVAHRHAVAGCALLAFYAAVFSVKPAHRFFVSISISTTLYTLMMYDYGAKFRQT